jgi:hypothetical protein
LQATAGLATATGIGSSGSRNVDPGVDHPSGLGANDDVTTLGRKYRRGGSGIFSCVADNFDADNARIWRDHARPLRAAHFDPLCSRLGLINAPDGPLAAQGYVSATGGNLRVHFENDRGLCYFALGPANEEQPLCGVHAIARRFSRIRLTSGGTQRLSLEEQAKFIVDHWAELQSMFSPEHVDETRGSLNGGPPIE